MYIQKGMMSIQNVVDGFENLSFIPIGWDRTLWVWYLD